ncbi:MAG: hypothetical protein ACI8RZ_000300 [Myxococcota bacterium]|jgi:hypothetical protein
MVRSLPMLSLLSVGLIAAGPVDSDDWTSLRAGATSTGQGVVVVSHSQQDIRGFTLQVAVSSVIGAPTSGSAALRLGYHGDYGGVELGAGGFFETYFDSRASINAWGGLPVAHLWVDTWPAEESGKLGSTVVGGGVGHHGARVSASAGMWATEYAGLPVSLRLAVRRNEGLWLGVSGWLSEDDIRGMLTVTISRSGLAAFYARGTAHPM